MQKCNLDLFLLKFKKRIQDKDLVTFFFFVFYNRFVMCQLYTINSCIRCKEMPILYVYIYIYIYNKVDVEKPLI